MANTTVACPQCGQLNQLDLQKPNAPTCGKCQAPIAWVVEATSQELADQLALPVVTLLKFTMAACAPCEQLDAELNRLATRKAGQIRVMHFDVTKNPAITQAWNVTSVPVVFVVAGGSDPQVAQRFNGLNPESVLLPAVEHAMTLLPAQQGQN